MTLLAPEPSPSQITLLRRGHQEVWWSTDNTVAVRGSGFSWDVRGYYRSLGVSFPYTSATRADLSKGYMAVDGQGSHWVTYCLKQLLDPAVRARYDACDLGEIFEDEYTAVDRRNAELDRRGARGDSIQDTAGEGDAEDSPTGMLDNDPAEGEDDHTPSAKDDDHYPYGVFVVGSVEADEIDIRDLLLWQTLIREEAQRVSLRSDVALGVTSGVASWTVGDVGMKKVVLLSQEYRPNVLDAARIVTALSDQWTRI